MDEFKRHLEQGKIAKQGSVSFERLSETEKKPVSSGNRVEDMLLDLRNAHSTPPVMPELKKVERREVAPEPVRIQEKRKVSFKKPLIILLTLIVLAGIGYGGYFAYNHFFTASSDTANILNEVGKQTGLPKGETPTIATVTDLEPLKSQPFFQNALVGDRVLIFGISKKAILYRPSTKKVITVAPLNN